MPKESGLYYLQSRYYDPEIGRFINADAFVSTGQGMLGSNMYAYCGNNPIMFADMVGYAFFPCNISAKGSGDGAVEQYPQEEEEPSYQGTVSLGVSGSIGVGPWIWGAQGFITVDANGNAAVQYGFWGGMSAGTNSDKFTGGITPFVMVTNAPGYEALEGRGFQMGGAFGGGALDYVGMLDSTGQELLYHGVAVGYGTTSSDFHVTWGTTYTWFATVFDWDRFYQVTRY